MSVNTHSFSVIDIDSIIDVDKNSAALLTPEEKEALKACEREFNELTLAAEEAYISIVFSRGSPDASERYRLAKEKRDASVRRWTELKQQIKDRLDGK